jgi:hypothetical protein
MAYEIFICYRRSDTAGYAGRLYDRLTTEYGLHGVLFDVAAAAEAELLRSWVERVVPKSAVVLVLIGDRWLEKRAGIRRLDEQGDIVRLEIELAVTHGIPILPVLIDGTPFPNGATLPDTIRGLSQFKGYPLGNAFWESGFKTLIDAVSSVAKTHVPILRQGVAAWNSWREQNKSVQPNLAHMPRPLISLAYADLSNANLEGADLSGVDLTRADLTQSNLDRAQLQGAKMNEASLHRASLRFANLSGATVTRVDLREADLRHTNLNDVDLTETHLGGCRVFGVSVWNAALDGAIQSNLRLDASPDAELTTDSIETAIILHLLMSSSGIRQIIDTLTSKVVLVLGRFTEQRKAVLDAIKAELRRRAYLPVLFDFQKPDSKDLTGTVTTLANMARFVIADLTDPSSVPHELATIASSTVVPVQTILLNGQKEHAMFLDLKRRYHWVLEPYQYESEQTLMENLGEAVIAPAEAKAKELMRR